jgi:hypothetical protein
MSSSSRPSLAIYLLAAAAAAWLCLVVVNLMMLVTKDLPYVGNPLYTLGIGVAIALTGAGHRQRLAEAARRQEKPHSSINHILMNDITGELHRPTMARPTVYRATARAETTARIAGTHVDTEVMEIGTRLAHRLRSVDG